jgi:hypothetical protein
LIELERLISKTGKSVALIIDEAQRALDTEAGKDAFWALKSARDQLMSKPDTRGALALIFTGSNQSKLNEMVINKKHAFFGSMITPMPYLDRDYIEDMCKNFNATLPKVTLSVDEVYEIFRSLGSRPAMLKSAIGQTIIAPGISEDFGGKLKATAEEELRKEGEILRAKFSDLNSLAQIVLLDIAQSRQEYSPFEAATLKRYTSMLKKKVERNQVQSAILQLVAKDLVWKSGRGKYLLEENWMKPQLEQIRSLMLGL